MHFLEKPTLKELFRFDRKTYMKLIKYLGQAYKIIPFSERPQEDIPFLVLRHDVDLSLLPALKMSEIEHDMGIKSSYFVLLSSKHYNSLEGRNIRAIKQISALGHEIGLHYDTYQYECYGRNNIDGLKMELQVLERIIGRKVTTISCHTSNARPLLLKTDGCINADDPNLRDIYVHDSRKLWTVKSLSTLLNNPPERAQLLIHPYHWEGKVHPVFNALNELLLNQLWLLYKVRTTFIRVLDTRESCEN
jgi:hypothetical protein